MDYIEYILKRKRIIIPIVALVIVSVALCSVAAHYLGKIQYDDGSSPASVRTSATDLIQPESSVSGSDSKNETLASDNIVDIENQDIGQLSLNSEQQEALSEADKQISKNLSDSKIWKSSDVLNILLAGIDYGSATYPYGRSDAMILVSVNKVAQTVKLISLSRAAYVSIPGNNNTRLSHAHGYGGPQLMLQTIEQNYKIAIDNYVSVDFEAFTQIVDILGGCTIELTKEEAAALKNKLIKSGQAYEGAGAYALTGQLALEYARLRKIDTDRDRTGRQRKLLASMLAGIKNMGFNQARTLLDSVLPLISTNLSKGDIIQYGLTAFASYINWPMSQDVLPHKSSSLKLIDGFEVVLIDWSNETQYAHSLVYGGLNSNSISYK